LTGQNVACGLSQVSTPRPMFLQIHVSGIGRISNTVLCADDIKLHVSINFAETLRKSINHVLPNIDF